MTRTIRKLKATIDRRRSFGHILTTSFDDLNLVLIRFLSLVGFLNSILKKEFLVYIQKHLVLDVGSKLRLVVGSAMDDEEPIGVSG